MGAVSNSLENPLMVEQLKILASPTRLSILEYLRHPCRLKDVRVTRGSDGPPISRQAIKKHLDELMSHGLVLRIPSDSPDTDHYVLNRGGVFRVVDQMRELTRMDPVVVAGAEDATTHASAHAGNTTTRAPKPRLVVVYGADDGSMFSLREGDAWTLGRGKDADICIEHDPHVSGSHVRIHRDEDGFRIEDIGSRNGIEVNFRSIGGRVTRLQNGDLLTVGKTTLLLQV